MVLTIHASNITPMLWDRNAAGDDMDDAMSKGRTIGKNVTSIYTAANGSI